jgi:hypothetical protein
MLFILLKLYYTLQVLYIMQYYLEYSIHKLMHFCACKVSAFAPSRDCHNTASKNRAWTQAHATIIMVAPAIHSNHFTWQFLAPTEITLSAIMVSAPIFLAIVLFIFSISLSSMFLSPFQCFSSSFSLVYCILCQCFSFAFFDSLSPFMIVFFLLCFSFLLFVTLGCFCFQILWFFFSF